jgi:hypothetical protein
MQKPQQQPKRNLIGLLAGAVLTLALTSCMPSDIAVRSNPLAQSGTTTGPTQQYFPQVISTNAQSMTAPLSQPGQSAPPLSAGGPAQLFMPLVQS